MKIQLLGGPPIPFNYTANNQITSEVMIHGIELINDQNLQIEVDQVLLRFYKQKRQILEKVLEGPYLKRVMRQSAKFINELMSPFTYSDLLTKNYFSQEFLTKKISPTCKFVKIYEKKLICHQFVSIRDEIPTHLEVLVGYRSGKRRQTSIKKVTLKRQGHSCSYILPLKGVVRCLAGPANGLSHHRQTTTHEFAWDFGNIPQTGVLDSKMKKNSDFYTYGKSVIAPAAGRIIQVKDGLAENRPFAASDWGEERVKKWGFLQNLFGNHVVIKHSQAEYSYLGHLKRSSILVKEGQKVDQGELIGSVGNNGASGGPHLHFHLMNGSEYYQSRSIPVSFSNIREFPLVEREFVDFNSHSKAIVYSDI